MTAKSKAKSSKAKAPKKAAGKTAKRSRKPKAAEVAETMTESGVKVVEESFFGDDDVDAAIESTDDENEDDMPGMRAVPSPKNGIRKQTELEGFEQPKIPEIEVLMAPFAEARYARLEAQKQEKIAGEALDAEMLARGITKYLARDGDVPIEVTVSENKRKLKLKKLDPEDVA